MRICIITVTYNDKNNLIRTLESIRKYKKEYHKYFVIDGNSSDGTLDEIKNNLDIIDDYISEFDKGIYDAMNKVDRLPIENYDYILWLNSGDELINWENINILELEKYDCGFYSVLSKMITSNAPILKKPAIKLPYNEKNFFPRSQFMHQGFIIKHSAFQKLKYNDDIGLQAENLLMSQCIQNYNFLISEAPISVFYLDGISNYKFKEIHHSYLRVAKKLGFDMFKIYYYQKSLILKYYIKRITPIKLINYYRVSITHNIRQKTII